MKYKDSKIHTGSLQQKVRKLENPIPGQPVWDWGPGRLRGLSPGCRGLSFDPFGRASLLFSGRGGSRSITGVVML